MKEYKTYYIETEGIDTEKELNKFAEEGWIVVCSYAWHNDWIILERDKKPKCKVCGK